MKRAPRISTLVFYRNALRSISKLQDKQIISSLRTKIRSTIKASRSLTQNAVKRYQEEQRIFSKWMSRCLQKHENSLLQLVRIYTSTTPLEYQPFMMSRPRMELESNQEYKKLSPEDKAFVESIVLKCCERPDQMFQSIAVYLKDARSEESWDWRKIPYNLDPSLRLEIENKVNNSLPYHYQYRSIFQHLLKFKQLDNQHILDDLKKCNYWIV